MAGMRRLLVILLALVVLAPGAQANPTTSPSPSPTASPTPTVSPSPAPTVSTVRVNPGPEADPLPEVFARSWVLADAETGAILAEKKMDTPRRPASTLKVLTALTLLPRLDPDQTYVVRKKEAEAYGSRAGIVRGKTYTIDQLMYGLLLPSGNDAAIALARANGGVPETVAQMNQVARDLQANDTTARNPSGLDSPGQLTTAYDLTVIARAALEREDFRTYVSAFRATIPAKGKKSRTIYNQNRLLTGGFKGAIGVKTGFTSKAGRTFIGAAERKGVTLIVTVLGSREPTADAARKLLTWGFANVNDVTPIAYLPPVPQAAAVEDDATQVVVPVVAEVQTPAAAPAPAPTTTEMSSIPVGVWGWPLLVVFLIGFALVSWRQARRRRRV